MAITKAISGKGNVKKLTNQDVPFNTQQPVISSFYAVSTASQTVINLGFSVDTVNNPDVFFLFVDGKKLTLGASNDYTFTSIAADGTSSQVTLNSSLPINLNIQAYKLGLKPEREFAIDNRLVTAYDYLDQSFQAFIAQNTLVTATSTAGTPAAGTFYSTISNRAAMVDLSQDLKPRMGIERLMAQSIYQLQNEFGPNGEPVWATPNDTFGQIRFVGSPIAVIDAGGQYIQIPSSTDVTEVTFYGTGLNTLSRADGAVTDYRYSVDGGAEFVYSSSTPSTVISARNYNANCVVNVVSGLTLGIHTVKIRRNSGSTLNFHGFEFLNESALVKVNPGVSYYKGQKYVSSALQSFSYSAPVTGTRGGRVLTYQTSTGAIGQSFQAVNGTATYLGSVSHINEEVSRVHAIREFGAGRSDDFSLITPASAIAAAFTLDDGTTTLVTSSAAAFVIAGQEGFSVSGSQFITLTFVGTGLDVDCYTAGADTFTVTVDGTAQGSMQTAITGKVVTETLASGLPYGTHTVKIARGTASSGKIFFRYRVYQPKKPSLPAGAVELADYNVMATYSQLTSVPTAGAGNSSISQGILQKAAIREISYTGTWAVTALSAAPSTGFVVSSSTSSSASCTFFGTGAEFRFSKNAAAQNFQISIDGSTNLSGFTTNLVQGGTGLTFTASTGTLSGTSSSSESGNSMSISGLALGTHTIKVTWVSGTNLFLESFDIITPIHSAKSNTVADLQNTLPVGSQAISDNRKTTPSKDALPVQKAWAQAVGVSGSPSTTSTSPIPCPDLSCTVKVSTATQLKVSATAGFTSTASSMNGYIQIYVDGVAFGPTANIYLTNGSAQAVPAGTLFISAVVPVSAGTHKVDLYWISDGATFACRATSRILTVEEK